MPVVGTEFDRREHDADVERLRPCAFLCPDTNPDSHALDCQFAKGSFLKVLNDTGAREPLW